MPEPTPEQMQDFMDWLIPTVSGMGLDLVGAVIVLMVGFWAAGRVRNWIRRALDKLPNFDDTLTSFLSSLARYVVIAITLLAVLNQFGVETTSFIALLGAAGLAVGLALQGTLSNVAAGVMLLVFRPFKIGQSVDIAGHAGTVKALSLFTTELATTTNVQIIIPNASVWGSSIKNFSAHDTRRCDFVVSISYETKIDDAMDVLKEVWSNDARVLQEPAPAQTVSTLSESSVDIGVRLWVKASDYWALKADFTKAFKEAFDANGIDIPFPTRTVINLKG